ncbi:hypothetical protein ACFFX0_02295 [Citricoccus parietis]|uniref:Secreted protein n=1 Tax=Citricoccus parietis TaxID=592307 RepID=A0ABV5FTR9_9MICC
MMAGSVLLVLLVLILRSFLALLAPLAWVLFPVLPAPSRRIVEVVDQRGPHPGEHGVGSPRPFRTEPGDQLLGPLVGDRCQPHGAGHEPAEEGPRGHGGAEAPGPGHFGGGFTLHLGLTLELIPFQHQDAGRHRGSDTAGPQGQGLAGDLPQGEGGDDPGGGTQAECLPESWDVHAGVVGVRAADCAAVLAVAPGGGRPVSVLSCHAGVPHVVLIILKLAAWATGRSTIWSRLTWWGTETA